MPLTSKHISAISPDDIIKLVDSRAREQQRLEFKRELPGNSDSEKREFLADISAFANAGGGDLLYGIDESGGEAIAVMALKTPDMDAEVLRLEAIARSGLDPRISALAVRAIKINAGYVLIVRVPRSWVAPHAVVHGGVFRFYSRTSAGKYQLDVRELRSVYLQSEAVEQRVRNFRTDRVSKVIGRDVPFNLDPEPHVILHVVPFSIGDPNVRLDVEAIGGTPTRLPPISSYGFDYRYNLDGFVTFCGNREDGRVLSYIQAFRDGSFEAVDAGILRQHGGKRLLAAEYLENKVVETVKLILAAQFDHGVAPPVVVLLTLVGVTGYRIVADRHDPFGDRQIDRDMLSLPEAIILDESTDVSVAVAPMFDALWNAAGWARRSK